MHAPLLDKTVESATQPTQPHQRDNIILPYSPERVKGMNFWRFPNFFQAGAATPCRG